MNERIEKLAELCGFRPSPSIYDRNQSFDVEKFAELIVRECIAKCDDLNSMKYIADHFEIKIEGLNDE